MDLNHFELRLAQHVRPADTAPDDPPQGSLYLDPSIWIDGQLLDEPHCVSVSAVLQAFAAPGAPGWKNDWHEIFTCGCGCAACANIDEGVGVVQGEDTVEWVFRRPQANKFGQDPIGYRRWCETATWHQYRFNRHQVTAELIRFLEEVWLVVKTSDVFLDNGPQVMGWFELDPRSPMRYRAIEGLEPPSR